MMALSQRQRWLILGGALLLTLAAVGWLSADGGSSPEVVEPAGPQEQGGRKPAVRESLGEELAAPDADGLKRALPEGEARNIFGKQTWFVAPPPPAPSKPAPPPLPFAYLGKMLDDGQATVFLTHQDRNLAVRTGDVINGTYRVDEINPPTMTFTYLPLNMPQQLEIGRAK